jgi:multidrug resistance efflux pump
MRTNTCSMLLCLVILAISTSNVFGQTAAGQTKKSISANRANVVILDERELSAEIPGLLVYVNPPTEGQLVKKGDVVIRLNDTVIKKQCELAQAKAASDVEIKFTEVALAKSLVDYDVQMTQQKESVRRSGKGVYTDSEMRQLELDVEKARASVEKSKEEKHILELEAITKEAELSQYTIVAPNDGVITKIHRRPGQSVRQGDPILTLTDLSVVRAIIFVDYGYRDQVRIGDEVEIMITQPDRTEASRGQNEDMRESDDAELADSAADEDVLGDFNASTEAVRKTAPAAAPRESEKDVVTAKAPARPGEKFLGKITFIAPRLSTHARELECWVDVPNRQDDSGRYALKERVHVDARIQPR